MGQQSMVKVEFHDGEIRWILVEGADPYGQASRLPGVRHVLACGPGSFRTSWKSGLLVRAGDGARG